MHTNIYLLKKNQCSCRFLHHVITKKNYKKAHSLISINQNQKSQISFTPSTTLFSRHGFTPPPPLTLCSTSFQVPRPCHPHGSHGQITSVSWHRCHAHRHPSPCCQHPPDCPLHRHQLRPPPSRSEPQRHTYRRDANPSRPSPPWTSERIFFMQWSCCNNRSNGY